MDEQCKIPLNSPAAHYPLTSSLHHLLEGTVTSLSWNRCQNCLPTKEQPPCSSVSLQSVRTAQGPRSGLVWEADCQAGPRRSPVMKALWHMLVWSHLNTQSISYMCKLNTKTTTPFSPDATTVLAHNVFSMLRLSWTGGSLSSYSGREKKEKCKLATFLLLIL